jgi:hypothetical protein
MACRRPPVRARLGPPCEVFRELPPDDPAAVVRLDVLDEQPECSFWFSFPPETRFRTCSCTDGLRRRFLGA